MCIRDRYKSIFLNIVTYGAGTRDMTRKSQKKLLAAEMDYLRRSYRKSKLERVGNEREYEHDESIVEEIEKNTTSMVWTCLLYTSRCV